MLNNVRKDADVTLTKARQADDPGSPAGSAPALPAPSTPKKKPTAKVTPQAKAKSTRQ